MSSVAIRTVPFTTRLRGLHAKEIVARDKARAQKFLAGLHPHGPAAFHEARRRRRGHGHGSGGSTGGSGTGSGTGGGSGTAPSSGGNDSSIDVTDAGVTYTASVGVGSPATQYTLLIDTGSSNTWVGAGEKYVKTSTSHSTGKSVNVSYGSGSFSGTEYTDTVTLAEGLVIQNQSIGVASTAQGFSDVDGILGIGPVDLTSTTVSGESSVPTVTDNLYAQGTIATESIGISYEPTTEANAANGELTFGGVDSSKYTGEITYVPITSTSPASQYWGIDQDVTYGQSGTSLLSGASGIVDTGTTLLLIATDAFQAYQKATGATLDQSTGLLTLSESQFNNLQSLYFNLGGTTFELTPNAQIWPRNLNSTIGGEEGKIYLIVSDLGSMSGSGLDFIDGFGFLQRFYSVYDTTNSQVGIANTPWTDATTN
ncbi:acid protease [Gloeophyllum trabeum ATCC 11539]|uniref:Acid protease n=1 Tax=Gloeophyllum trabeum (strain ATCC 11539 / FP-39264 / Madison 617) TaxID=670483 RepID=S7Q4G9_GLOTA|nr:acid protease [Gloeophyllum trabeum ATCC 11539]EPQ54402.1 acid protease [Gloeophyllum trabeum ATCC 11539]